MLSIRPPTLNILRAYFSKRDLRNKINIFLFRSGSDVDDDQRARRRVTRSIALNRRTRRSPRSRNVLVCNRIFDRSRVLKYKSGSVETRVADASAGVSQSPCGRQCSPESQTRPARPASAVDNLGTKRLHEALQSAQAKRQRLSPPFPAPGATLLPLHPLAVHRHLKAQQSIVQQSIVQQQLNLAHQSLSAPPAAGPAPAPAPGAPTAPPPQPSPRATSPHHKNMELALCQSMDSVNTATAEEEVRYLLMFICFRYTYDQKVSS